MNSNYEKTNKKLLQKSDKYNIMNLEDFAKEYEKEQKLPESVRGNAPWVKELYGELQSRPVTATFGAQKKNGLLTDFAKEAESIYKLDAKNRELPIIKEYMRDKYVRKQIFDSSVRISMPTGNIKTPEVSIPQNSQIKNILQKTTDRIGKFAPENELTKSSDSNSIGIINSDTRALLKKINIKKMEEPKSQSSLSTRRSFIFRLRKERLKK